VELSEIEKRAARMPAFMLLDRYEQSLSDDSHLDEREAYKRELLRRLKTYRLEVYPCSDSRVLDKEHPFESYIKTPRVRQALRKDQSLAIALYQCIAGSVLFRTKSFGLTALQGDLFLDTYHCTPERASAILCRSIRIKNEEYFSSNPKLIVGKMEPRAVSYLESIGWHPVKKEV